jgi:peptidyl-tRNA hydrolase ICT1
MTFQKVAVGSALASLQLLVLHCYSTSLSLPSSDWLDISYSRSSGPGGQNVNKVSTQAHLVAPYSTLQNLLAPYALRHLISTSRFIVQAKDAQSATAANGPSLRISSSSHRTQPENLRDCYRKLWDQVLTSAKADLAGETTVEQQQRVKSLQAKEKRKLVQVKKQRKVVKSGRRAGKGAAWD